MLDVTEIREHYASQFKSLEQRLNGNKNLSLHRWREDAFARMSGMPFPTSRFEEWRYTNVDPILNLPFETYEGTAAETSLDKLDWKETPFYRLVFVNGSFSAALSDVRDLPRGVTMIGLREAGQREPDGVSSIAKTLPQSDDNIFAEMNNAFMWDGMFIRIADGTNLDKPIHCVFWSVPKATPLWTQPRNLIHVGAGARVNITEQYATLGGGVHLTNAVTQLVIDEDASADYQKIQDESREAFHVAMTHVRLRRNSRLKLTTVTMGARLTRNMIHTVLEDEGIEATLNGLYLADGNQHVDHRTFIDHAKPHCASHELYKGILDGQSTGVFNGKIMVRPDAQKTNAKQSNNNLLLSADATVNTKPQLEIFADDVKCTHGATIGRLDDEAMFYLRSRGLSTDAARNILTYAFASDIVDRIEVPSLREQLDAALKERLQH